MVRIPKLGTGQQISTDVPSIPSRGLESAGIVGRSTQQLGETISQVGHFAAQLNAKRRQAETESYTNTAFNELRRTTISNKLQTKKEMSGTGYYGYADQNDEFNKKQIDKILDNAPNEEAKQFIKLKANTFLTNQKIDNSAEENSYRSAFFYNNFQQDRDKNLDFLSDNPDLDTAMDIFLDDESSIKAGSEKNIFWSQEDALKLKKNQGAIAKTTLDGMIRTGGTMLLEAKEFLDGKRPEYEQLKDSMTSHELLSYKRQVERGLKLAEQEVKIDMIFKGKNLANQAALEFTEKGYVSQKTKEALDQSIAVLGNSKDPKLKNIGSILSNNKKSLEYQEEFKSMDSDFIINSGNPVTITDKSSPEEFTQYRLYEKAKADILQKRAKNPGGTYKSDNPRIAEGSKEFFEGQKELGYSNPQYLSNSTMEAETNNLLNAPEQGRVIALQQFLNKENRGVNHLRQMYNKDNKLAPFVLASHMTNPNVQNLLLISSDEAKSSLDKAGISTSIKNAKLKEINEKFDTLRRGFNGADMSDKLYSSLKQAALISYSKQMNLPGNDETKAMEIATNEILNEYVVIENNNKAAPVLIPKKNLPDNFNSRDASRFFTGITDPFRIEATSKMLGVTAKNNRSPDMTDEEFMDYVMTNNLMPILSDDGESYMLGYVNRQSRVQPLLNANGIVRIPIENINAVDPTYGDFIVSKDVKDKEKIKLERLRKIPFSYGASSSSTLTPHTGVQ